MAAAPSPSPSPDHFNIVHPDHYGDHGYPHDIFARLRREDPVHWWTKTDGMPFWAITKHADIITLSKRPETFLNAPRLTISHEAEEPEMGEFPPTLIQMDNPRHRVFRSLISKRFTPRYLRKINDPIEEIGKEIVDALLDKSSGDYGECDFVTEVSAPLPIAVIGWLLGVPKEDWRLLFDWTNRTIGAGDAEFQTEGVDPRDSARGAMIELFTYYAKLLDEKRKNPEDDLATLFTQMEVDGKKLELMDQLAWCLIITVAGNETTRNGTSGGMLAFVEHQDQLRKLQQQPELLYPAVEEVVRWTSPIIHFARTAARDFELRGRNIQEGQACALFYPSANRDEEVFPDGHLFRVDRDPNHHLGFGIGEHFCLGSHLARLELAVAYKHLLPRLEEVELAGPVSRLHSSLVGGVKHLPIRYKLKPAA